MVQGRQQESSASNRLTLAYCLRFIRGQCAAIKRRKTVRGYRIILATKRSLSMGNDLHAASSQWASRPADERFWNLADLKNACEASRNGSAVARVKFGDLRAESRAGELAIVGDKGNPARLTHYAFGQLAGSVGAPAGYLRELPTHVAAECLN